MLLRFSKPEFSQFFRAISSLNLPKRPPNAYSEFVREKMEELRNSDDPDKTFKHMSEMWKSMSPEEKNLFYNKQHSLKQFYDKKMDDFYEKTHLDELSKWKRKIQVSFDLNKLRVDNVEKNLKRQVPEIHDPLRPASPYEMWMRDPQAQAKSDGTESRKEELRGPQETWDALPAEEKKKYEDAFKEKMKKYTKIKEALTLIREWNEKLRELKQDRKKRSHLTHDEKIVEGVLTQTTPLIDSEPPAVETIKSVAETIDIPIKHE